MQGGYYGQPMQNGMYGNGAGMMGVSMGMNPALAQQQQQMAMMGGQTGVAMNDMGMGYGNGMGMGMVPRAVGMMGPAGMGMIQAAPPGVMSNSMPMPMAMGGMGWSPGEMRRHLGYNYNLPQLGYKPDASWSPWDLATRAYTGDRMERGFFDNIISTLSNFFSNRHLSEEAARNAHRRVYHLGEGEDSGSKSLGGAAAYQAFLHWDRDHHSLYHSYPTNENRERLVALAVAELFRLWDQVQPRSSRASIEDAAQYAAATAKYLFDRHYDLQGHGHGHGYGGHGRHGSRHDDESDGESDSRRRRKSFYGQPYGYGQMPGHGVMNPHMAGGMGMGMGGMQNMGGMPMSGMGMQGMMPPGINMNPMMINPSMLPQGMHGQMGEAQAVPGMHPYSYGPNSGVAMGNQPIDQMGNPTFPGGPGGRTWYGYGQPRYY